MTRIETLLLVIVIQMVICYFLLEIRILAVVPNLVTEISATMVSIVLKTVVLSIATMNVG